MTALRLRLAIALLIAGALSVWADAPASEYAVKSAFLYNFTRFVEWPATPDSSPSTFDVCIAGQSPFTSDVEASWQDKIAQDKRLVLRSVLKADELAHCRILFIPGSRNAALHHWLDQAVAHAILTVGESTDFVSQGGMVGFMVEDRRVRFAINRKSAEASGLRISSQMLKLAKTVDGKSPAEGERP